MVNGWKVAAIIFIVYSILLSSLFVWGYVVVTAEEEAINDCYYNTCAGYPEAWYEYGICTCYDIDEYGDYEVAKTEYNP